MNQSDLFARARDSLAGGVSASMRYHPYLGRPFYVDNGQGPYIFDSDGNRLIDFNNSNGATMLGHRHPAVLDALNQAVEAGFVTAGDSERHVELAERLVEIIPSAERVRFASTGTEVTSIALRLARHITGRQRFLKFEGHFHGLSDAFLIDPPAHPHGSAIPRPASGGVPTSYAYDVEIVPWNDPDAFDEVMHRKGRSIAAIICEPVWYNAGCVPPTDGFLEHLRAAADDHGCLLIFDEVLSGFRMSLGGAQEHYGVTPDLTTLAKALANGMPLSALVGKAEYLEELAPVGPVAHSGTYSGHPMSVAAAHATLDVLTDSSTYENLNSTAEWFYEQLQEMFDSANLPVRVQGLGSRFGLYFGREERVVTSSDAATNDHSLNAEFVRDCVKRGVYFHAYRTAGPPGHAGITLSHDRDCLSDALTVIQEVAKSLGR